MEKYMDQKREDNDITTIWETPMNSMSDSYDVIVTRGIIHLIKSRQRCEACEYWAPVYCLENRKEKIHTLVEVSKNIAHCLVAIPTLKWGRNKSNVMCLFNHCQKCNVVFFDANLFHPGAAFTPLRESQCEEMLIIELPITSPQRIVGSRLSQANNIHLDHARRITWEKYTQEFNHDKHTESA